MFNETLIAERDEPACTCCLPLIGDCFASGLLSIDRRLFDSRDASSNQRAAAAAEEDDDDANDQINNNFLKTITFQTSGRLDGDNKRRAGKETSKEKAAAAAVSSPNVHRLVVQPPSERRWSGSTFCPLGTANEQ